MYITGVILLAGFKRLKEWPKDLGVKVVVWDFHEISKKRVPKGIQLVVYENGLPPMLATELARKTQGVEKRPVGGIRSLVRELRCHVSDEEAAQICSVFYQPEQPLDIPASVLNHIHGKVTSFSWR